MKRTSSVSSDEYFEKFGEFLREVSFEPQRLNAHPTYRSLCKQLPGLMARAPTNHHLWHCMYLVDLITQYGAARVAKRAKKARVKASRKDRLQRIALQKDIGALVNRLWNAPWLSPGRQQLLIYELRAAGDELKAPPPARNRSIAYPELYDFAHRFLRRYEIADDPDLLLEFATWAGIECDVSTAQRYLQKDRKR